MLLGHGEPIAVVVRGGVAAIERVRVRPLAGVGQGLAAVVEIQRRLVLEAVLDAVAVAVGLARVELQRDLERIAEEIVVVVRIHAVGNPVAVAIGRRTCHRAADARAGRVAEGDARRQPDERVPFAKRLESTRRRTRVGCATPSFTVMYFSSDLGMTTFMLVRVA